MEAIKILRSESFPDPVILILRNVLPSKYRKCRSNRDDDLDRHTVHTICRHVGRHGGRAEGIHQSLDTHAAQCDHAGLECRRESGLHYQPDITSLRLPFHQRQANLFSPLHDFCKTDHRRSTLCQNRRISCSRYSHLTHNDEKQVKHDVHYRGSDHRPQRSLRIPHTV